MYAQHTCALQMLKNLGVSKGTWSLRLERKGAQPARTRTDVPNLSLSIGKRGIQDRSLSFYSFRAWLPAFGNVCYWLDQPWD